MSLSPSRRRSAVLAAGAVTGVLVLAACSGEAPAAAPTTDLAVPQERCDENRDAGTITFLTGYQYQASASILEVIAADALGYYDAVCLDVEIQPGTGDTGQNAQLVAAGTVTISGISQQDTLLNAENGIDLVGISTYSDAGLEILMTMPDITDLAQLDGTVLGQKGAMPTTVQAMLEEAGADFPSIQQVTVGYDPSVLPRGQVQSLTGFISNEPNLLEAAGEEVTVWRPDAYDIPSSLGAFVANPEFVSEHPEAVQDFLRATFHAFDHCTTAGEECVGYAAELSGEGYDPAHNLRVWETEVGVIEESAGDRPLGALDLDTVSAIADMLVDYDLIGSSTASSARDLFDPSLVEAVYDGDALVWPAA